jgi:hypothetical protein
MTNERLQIIGSLNTTDKPVSVSELVNISGLGRGKVLGHLPRLCLDGLVDKRAKRYALTHKGRLVIREIRPVSDHLSFRFFHSESVGTGLVAQSFIEFFKIVQKIDNASLEFHDQRGDFSKWFQEVYNDEELAATTAELTGMCYTGDVLRTELSERLKPTYNLLKTLLS